MEGDNASGLSIVEKPHQQVGLVSEFSAFMGNSILPPSYDASERLGVEEFAEEYPVRYDIWDNLRDLRSDYSREAQERLKRLGKFLHILNSLDNYISAHHKDREEGTQTLWDEQLTVFESVREGLEHGQTDGYVKLPTGTGKTVLFTEFVEALGLETKMGEPIKSLIVVPSTIPIGQTEEALKEFAKDLPFGKVYSEQKDIGEKAKPVTIITDESLQIQIDKGNIDPLDYDVVVLDEVHKYLSPAKIELFKKFPNAIKLGFTATPNYSEQKNVKNLLLPYEYANMTIVEAVEKGMLSSFNAIIAECNIDISGVQTGGQDAEYNEEELKNKIDIKQLNDKVAQFYQSMFTAEAGVIFCAGVAHAEHVAQSFNEQEIKAGVISGYMDQGEKEEVQKKFKKGEFQVLCNSDILIESFDEPRASVCINLRPTMSAVVAEQRSGRVLRLDRNNLDKHATIVDFLFSNSNRESQQVLYSDVAQAAESSGKNYESHGRSKKLYEERAEQLSLEGINIVIETEEILRIVSEKNKLKYTVAPPGWSNYSDIMTEIEGISVQKIKKMLAPYRELHPEYFKYFLTGAKNNRIFEHMSPVVVDFIKSNLARVAPPPGWVKLIDLSTEVKRSIPTLLYFTTDEERGKFRAPADQEAHYVSAEVAQKIRNEFGKLTSAPEGWRLESDAAQEFNVDPRTFKKLASKYTEGHPGGTGTYLSSKNTPARYYSQNLLDSLKAEKIIVPKEPGWTSNYSLAKQFGVDETLVYKIALEFSADHPEWISRTQLRNGESRSYNSDLTSLVKKALGERVTISPGFLSLNEAAILTDADYMTIKRYSSEIKKSHPEYFIIQRSASGRITEHIHQDALKLIEQMKATPTGYFNLQEASEYLKRMPITVRTHAVKLAKERFPGEVVLKPIVGTSKNETYISPAVVEALEKEYTEFKPAPEGWVSFGKFRSKTGHSQKWIDNRLDDLKESLPGSYGKFYNSSNVRSDYMSPEAVKFLEGEPEETTS